MIRELPAVEFKRIKFLAIKIRGFNQCFSENVLMLAELSHIKELALVYLIKMCDAARTLELVNYSQCHSGEFQPERPLV